MLANPAGEKPEFITDKLSLDVADFLAKYKVKFKAEHESGWLKAVLSWVVPRIAVHETGHALVTMALPGTDPVQKISIIPRGVGALGYTMQRPIEDRFLMSRAELEDRLAVLLGGRAAETLRLPSVSTGAADDLRKATEIARNMVMRFGMAPELGPVAYDEEPPSLLTSVPGMPSAPRRYSEATATRMDAAVLRLIEESLERAEAILKCNAELLNATAQRMLEQETLGEDWLGPLAGRVTVSRRPEPATHASSSQIDADQVRRRRSRASLPISTAKERP
jgi:cell division protease FtsH